MAACEAQRGADALRLDAIAGVACSGRAGAEEAWRGGEGAGGTCAPCRIGRWRLLREINRGATAVVYEAVDAGAVQCVGEAGQRVALKVMRTAPCGRLCLPPGVVAGEIKVAASLRHRNIVGLYDVEADGPHLALVLELVAGPDLLEYAARCGCAVPEQHAVHYIRQLLDAVAHMHAAGLTHRDLKPENCMVDLATRTLKVTDFGLAGPTGAAVRQGCGTVYTIAPECIARPGAPPPTDAAALDAWGIGVTLFILLAGYYPFEDPEQRGVDQATLRNTVRGRMRPLPPHVSPAARDLVGRLLRVDPGQRATLEQVSRHPFLAQRVHHQAMLALERRVFAGRYGLPGACAGPDGGQQPPLHQQELAAEAPGPAAPEAQSPHVPLPAVKEAEAEAGTGAGWSALFGGGQPCEGSADTSLSDESSSSTP